MTEALIYIVYLYLYALLKYIVQYLNSDIFLEIGT